MLNKYYRLREIILGLRAEYQRNLKELGKLSDYIILKDKNIEKVEFTFPKYSDDETADLACIFTIRREKLELVKNNIKTISNYRISRKAVYRNPFNEYEIEGNYDIFIKDSKDFAEQIHYIKGSPFAKNIEISDIMNIRNGSLDYSMQITDWGIAMSLCRETPTGDLYFSSYTTYDAKDDEIKLEIYSNKALENSNKTNLDRVLNVKVPKESLGAYHRGIIDYNEQSAYKLICKDKENSSSSQSYSFSKGNKRMLLIKK